MQLSAPTYLRLKSTPFDQTKISIREHVPPQMASRSERPLVLLTFHPGYLMGSYQDRDYFARLSPLLFQWAQAACRLHVFTINHPGYDQPKNGGINRFRLEPYSIYNQPLAMQAAFSWLLEERLAQEPDIVWIAYGHSMGGLALSQYQPAALIERLAQNGRRLHFTKIFSAPAIFLHPQARATLGQLDLLHTLKHTVGRLPLYALVATGLYRAFAPIFYQRGASKYSIQAMHEFGDFRHLDPFLLLEQGRELILFEETAVVDPGLLADTHVILARQDGMIDVPRIEELIEATRQAGYPVTQYDIDSTHLLELDAPQAVAETIWQVITAEINRLP